MIDTKPDGLQAMKSFVDDLAGFIKSEDDALRRRQSEHGAIVSNSSERSSTLHSLLWNGEDRATGAPLSDEQVIPTMKAYINAAIENAQLRVQHPWNDEDFQQASRELAWFTQVQERGMEGLLDFCQQRLDLIPRKRDTEEIDASLTPLVQRWQHYQELIRAAK